MDFIRGMAFHPEVAPPLLVTTSGGSDGPPPRPERPRRGLFRRRPSNRRVRVVPRSLARGIEGVARALGRRLVVAGKALAVVASLAGAAWGGQRVVRHVIASPRFAVREVRVGATAHVAEDEVIALAGVSPGDRLLAVDTDAVAARVAAHPWVASARVRRMLPSTLVIDVTERQAVASALLGTLYLVDSGGHPFKCATMAEADGLPVITGVRREQYTAYREATEAAFREALGLLTEYGRGAGRDESSARAYRRPPLSEVHIDPRYGFSLVLFEGGGEIRLGRGEWAHKLARLDDILATLNRRGLATLRTIYLDGAGGAAADRVAVKVDAPPAPPPANHQKISGGDKTR